VIQKTFEGLTMNFSVAIGPAGGPTLKLNLLLYT